MRFRGACWSALVRSGMTVACAVAAASCTFVQPDRGPVATVERAVLPMADAALDAGQVETARRLYTRLLEVDEGSVAARTGLGRVAMAERDPGRAASWYLAAAVHATLAEDRHAALLAHGRAALAAGQHEAAMRSFARLASPEENASDVHAAWAHNGVGMVRWLDGDPRGAVAAIEKAVLRDPEETAFRRNLAVAVEMLSSMTLAPPPAAQSTEEASDWAAPPGAGTDTAVAGAYDVPPNAPEAVPITEAQEPAGDGAPDEVEPVESAHEVATTSGAERRTDQDVSVDADAPHDTTASEAVDTDAPHDTNASEAVDADAPQGATAREIVDADASGDTASDPVAEQPEYVREADTHIWIETDEVGDSGVGGVTRTTVAEPLDPLDDDAKERVAQAEESTADQLEEVAPDSASLPGLAEFAEISELAGDGSPTATESTGEPSPDELVSDLGAFVLIGADGADYVQAGAYSSRPTADALAVQLQDLTAIPVSVGETADGRDSHRVRIGPLDVDELPALAAALEDSGFGGIRMRAGDRAEADDAMPGLDVDPGLGEDDGPTPAATVADGAPDVRPVSDLEAFVLTGEDGADYVQVGAYASRTRANALAVRLQDSMDIPVSVVEPADSRDSHRVRVGPLDIDELPTLAALLAESGFGGLRMRTAAGDRRDDVDDAPPSIVVVGDGGRYLQVGAYGDPEAAEALAARLRTQTGELVTVTAWTKDDGTPVHRVRIGPLDDARSAALADLVGEPTPR